MTTGRAGREGFSRRELLRAGAGAGLTLGLTPGLAGAATGRPARRRRRQVAVLGGGMAGLTAAHELIERGFDVTVYERNALGGKARSIPVRGSGAGGRRDLPGEHGFRFFPGFYHHIPDSMRRIPFGAQAGGVRDNLVTATGGKFLRADGRADAGPVGIGPDPETVLTVDGLRKVLTESLTGQNVPPQELAYFVERALIFLTSCDERRFSQWEHTSWWDFVRAEGRSQEYKTIIAAGLTRNLVAAKETVASTRTIGNMAEAFVFTILGLGNDGSLDRVLDLPTNEAWIDPWVTYLRRRGVRFAVGRTVESLEVGGGVVRAARVRDARGRRHRIDADWFVCAMPAERARRLWSPGVLKLAPALEGMNELFVDWMVGIQFFLKRPAPITRGHISFIDAPWALTALTQGQFWEDRSIARDYGDGRVVDILSVDISNWDAPGILFGRPAKACTAAEVAQETWAQIKRHHTAAAVLPDDILHSWHLDPGVAWVRSKGRNRNDTPLLVNTVGSWDKRPDARTAIPNLFLAGDYVRTNIDLATMEGANESAREAVAGLLEAVDSPAERPAKYRLYQPRELDGLKAIDRARLKAGQPHMLDVG